MIARFGTAKVVLQILGYTQPSVALPIFNLRDVLAAIEDQPAITCKFYCRTPHGMAVLKRATLRIVPMNLPHAMMGEGAIHREDCQSKGGSEPDQLFFPGSHGTSCHLSPDAIMQDSFPSGLI